MIIVPPELWPIAQEIMDGELEPIEVLKKNMNPVKTPLFETPPIEGELWYDVQFEMDVDPGREGNVKWLYFDGVPTFKSVHKARRWVTRLQAQAQAAGYTLPPLRFKAHLEPRPENSWIGHPIPMNLIPKVEP